MDSVLLVDSRYINKSKQSESGRTMLDLLSAPNIMGDPIPFFSFANVTVADFFPCLSVHCLMVQIVIKTIEKSFQYKYCYL